MITKPNIFLTLGLVVGSLMGLGLFIDTAYAQETSGTQPYLHSEHLIY